MESDFGPQPFIFCNNLADRKQRVAKSKEQEQGSGDEQTSDAGEGSAEGEEVEGESTNGGENPQSKSDLGTPKGIKLSDKVDDNGHKFVLTSNGNLTFGEIGKETGLTEAPIMLSEGVITNHKTKDGYGLVHIEAKHGDEIRNAGFESVLDFIETVARNYDTIKEGSIRKGIRTYRLLLTDKKNNTLMVELSGDGSYWTINTAGVFKKSYGKNKKEVYSRHTTAKQSAETVETSQGSEQSGTQEPSRMNVTTLPSDKGTNKSETLQEGAEKNDKKPIDKINEHRATEGLEEVSEEEVALRDALNEQLKKSGIDVVTDVENGERVLAMAEDNDVKENKVYHGSGADFDEFDHSHIGEGEGAQAFGRGTYLTEVKGIGEGYARKMGKYPQKRALKEAMRDERMYEKSLVDAKAELLDSKNIAEAEKQKYENLKAQAEQIKSEYGETSVEYDNFIFDNDLDKAERQWKIAEESAKRNEADIEQFEQKLQEAKQKVSEAQAAYDKEAEGHKSVLYTVEAPDDNGKNFLHWESQTPSETVEKIRDYVREHCSEEVAEEFDKQIAYGTDNPDLAEYGQNGENVYKAVEYALGSDKKASLVLSELGMQGISYPADFMRGGRADGARNYVIFKEEDAKITDKVRFFKTKNGKAYGFTVGGKIYVDPRIAKADTPIHEYSHLWESMFRDVNPKEWSNVVKLMKDSPLWEEIRKKYPELKTDDEIADEVLAHFSGKRRAERLRQAQQEAMKEKGVSAKASAISAIERVRKALSTFWKGVCELLHIHFTSAEEVADRVLSDMLNGVDPVKVKNEAKKGEKTLVGVHNISEDKLEKAMKQGGLANPSLAVIDSSKQKHDGYGDISLIMPSNKVAKRSGKNAGTWQGDAWTPTYPQVERKMSDKGSAKASKDIQSVPKEMQRSVSNGIDRWLEGQSNSEMAYLFLHERGEAPEMQHAMSKYGEDMYNKIKKMTNGNFSLQGLSEAEKNELLSLYIESKFNGDEVAYRRNLEEWVAKNRKRAEENKGLIGKGAKENVELYDKYGIDYKSVELFAQDVRNDHNSTLNPDSNLTAKAAEEYIQSKNLQGEFEKWLEGKTNEYGVKEVIFDGYTPSGKRRYVDNTLENVSRLMKGEGRNGATGWSGSFSDFAARLMPSYSKLEEIRTKKGLLTNDHADVEAFREKWSKVYTELGMKCQPDAKGQFDTYGMERLSEAATQKNPQQYLKEQYGVELSDADAKRLNEMIEAIKKEYPAMYFETKYERPVMFNEFASAVVPKTLKESTKEFLRKQGLTLYEYDKDIEGDRQRAFDEASSGEGIRFQFVGEKGAENADKLEEADRRMDNLRVAREMEKSEKDAKSIKIATGWERGADGKWRYEIPDVKYHPEGDAEYEKIRNRQRWSKELDELSDKVFEGKKLSDKEEKQFDELVQLESEFKADYLSQEKPYLTNWVENDELFASYPELKQTQIIFTDQLPERTAGYYSEKDNTIVVNTKSSLAYESIIAHEVQHAIQRIEGFARGGSIEEIEKDFQRAKEEVRARSWAFQLKETAKELGGDYNQLEVEKALIKEYEDMNMSDMMPDEETRIKGFNYFARGYADRSLDDAIKRYKLDTSTGSNFNSYKEYQKLAGEVESRNVQERMYMTSEERRKSLAAETEDVSREDQIFLYGETGINEIVSPAEMDESAKAERGNRLMNAPAVDVKSKQIVKKDGTTARQAAEKWWKENIGKSLFYDTEIGKVEINEKSIGTSLAHRYGQPKLDAITSLKEGFGNAVYLGSLPDFVRQVGVLNHYFAYPINYDGKRCYVFCRAMQDANKNRLYVHEVFVADNIQNEGNTLQTAAFQPHGGIALYKSILSDILSAANLGRNTESAKNSDDNLHYRDEKEVQRVNEKFNEELQMQIDGKLPENHIYKIGKPGSVLRSTGVPDLPIQMSARRLQEKATLFDHNFDLRDVKDLVQALQDPLAIFAYGDKTKAQNIIIPLQKGGRNFIVGLSLRPIVNGSHLEINSIRNVFPKDNSEWLNWINQGKALYLNKEKIQILIDQQRTNLADVDYLDLDSMAKVIENFENPKNVDEKLKYRTSSEIDAEYPSTSATDPESKTSRAIEISEHLNTPVRVITSEKEMEGLSPRQKKAKGWYNTATGEVVVVVSNNADVADVENTVLHEVIGHDGIRDFRL